MAKSSYFSNSAKLLCFVAVLLFSINALLTLGSFEGLEVLSQWGTSLSNFSFYVILVIGFIAFNGEGVGHKRYRDRKSKKVTDRLKLLLFFCFFLRFFKQTIEYYVMKTEGGFDILMRFIMSVVSTVGSYGFLLFVVTLWYILRDADKKELMPFEVSAFIFGLLYNIYKIFNFCVVKYNITILGDLFSRLFSSDGVFYTLCLLQLFVDIVMFARVCTYYDKLGEEEQKDIDSGIKKLTEARNVYKQEEYGIDTLEDDFLAY